MTHSKLFFKRCFETVVEVILLLVISLLPLIANGIKNCFIGQYYMDNITFLVVSGYLFSLLVEPYRNCIYGIKPRPIMSVFLFLLIFVFGAIPVFLSSEAALLPADSDIAIISYILVLSVVFIHSYRTPIKENLLKRSESVDVDIANSIRNTSSLNK